MALFNCLTVWRVEARLPEVWEAIFQVGDWPLWWRGLENLTELEPGEPGGVGSLRRFTWKGLLPYRLTFDIRTACVLPGEMIVGLAVGDLSGQGVWRFSREGGATVVRYRWRVRTMRWWLSLVSDVARPLVDWNHARVMSWGGQGLARRLDAPVSTLEEVSLPA